jgi:hypothetical protein
VDGRLGGEVLRKLVCFGMLEREVGEGREGEDVRQNLERHIGHSSLPVKERKVRWWRSERQHSPSTGFTL